MNAKIIRFNYIELLEPSSLIGLRQTKNNNNNNNTLFPIKIVNDEKIDMEVWQKEIKM